MRCSAGWTTCQTRELESSTPLESLQRKGCQCNLAVLGNATSDWLTTAAFGFETRDAYRASLINKAPHRHVTNSLTERVAAMDFLKNVSAWNDGLQLDVHQKGPRQLSVEAVNLLGRRR